MGAFSSSAYSPIAFSTDEVVPPTPTERSSFQIVQKRKEVNQRVVLDDGSAITIRVMDGLLIDDLLISGMKAEGYRIMTGKDVFPEIDRKLKDYLIKVGVIQE
jgi:hypothetical protein